MFDQFLVDAFNMSDHVLSRIMYRGSYGDSGQHNDGDSFHCISSLKELLSPRYTEAAKDVGYGDAEDVCVDEVCGYLGPSCTHINLPLTSHPFFQSDHLPLMVRLSVIQRGEEVGEGQDDSKSPMEVDDAPPLDKTTLRREQVQEL